MSPLFETCCLGNDCQPSIIPRPALKTISGPPQIIWYHRNNLSWSTPTATWSEFEHFTWTCLQNRKLVNAFDNDHDLCHTKPPTQNTQMILKASQGRKVKNLFKRLGCFVSSNFCWKMKCSDLVIFLSKLVHQFCLIGERL